ncbi:SDR family oxidoreductase [Pseudonocardia spinosispora]|uniref:SDR family oxidoreductase n=1 Tax=Pseudonocardia spinosispora TaxID=103441 RepID=UPI00041DA5AB|nr:SDR family oxidoreductase [Pseudonocardia spinosispora]
MTLRGRTALVVGGAGGIGQAIARAFEAEGASVVIADRKSGGITIDVSREDSVASAVAAAEEQLGRIDVLVNSAGILTESPLVDMELGTWSRTLAVNLTGVFLCCRAVLPGMLERRSGRIINIASQLALKGGLGMAHYAAAKAGVIALTKSLALEVADRGILVNAIAPGPIETPMLAGITDDWRAAKQAELPLGRFGRPEEIAPTAVLLASDPGGNLYLGQTLGPNSGDVMP